MPLGSSDPLREAAAMHTALERSIGCDYTRGPKCPSRAGVTSQNLSQRIALPVMHQMCRPKIVF